MENVNSLSAQATVLFGLFFSALSLPLAFSDDAQTSPRELPYTDMKRKVVRLDIPVQDNGHGGLIAADLNGDHYRDFVVTKPGHVAAYDHQGKKLWTKQINIQLSGQSERFGLPGWHAPGVQAADIDADGQSEVLFLTLDNRLHIVRGADGEIRKTLTLESPPGADRWEHLVVADFRGKGDLDLLLQATHAEGYRMGRHLAAYALDDLLERGETSPLWTRNDFVPNAHNGARVADLNQDGKDEVLGGMILDCEGRVLCQIPVRGHLDSIFVADVRSDIPGLEVVALEEGGGIKMFESHYYISRACNRIIRRLFGGANRIFLYNHTGLIWESHYKDQEPQNAAVGEFDLEHPGLEIWCRSRYDQHQKPFVFDAQGRCIARYEMDDVAPREWTVEGVEVISPIHWTGGQRQLAAAKERHKAGDVAIFDPITGDFLYRFKEEADRIYVADVLGDWREEMIVLSGNELHIYSNQAPNPNPRHPRLWTQRHYRRSKITYNYYSP